MSKMTSKAAVKRTSSPASTSLGRARTRASSRERGKRTTRKMNGLKETKHPADVDNESIPLSEKGSNTNTNTELTTTDKAETEFHNGCDSTTVIPNAIQSRTGTPNKETNEGKFRDKTTGVGSKQQNNIVISDSNIIDDKTLTVPNGTGNVVLNKDSQHNTLVTTGAISIDHRNGNVDEANRDSDGISVINVPLPEPNSLTVPGTSDTTTPVNNGSQRKDSVLSFARENSRVSSESFRSMDIKYQYTSVQMVHAHEERPKTSAFAHEDSWIRVAIPYLPVWLAVTCLIMNIFLPGTGTMLSGLSIFCCAKSRVPAKYDQDAILITCVNMWVGVAQLFTVTFMLVGWFWGLAWGIKMVILAVEWRRERRQQRTKDLQTLALSAFGSTLPGRLAALT